MVCAFLLTKYCYCRILKALKGIPDDHSSRDGLLETIQRSKNHYQKRAYQCIKILVALFSQCAPARAMLDSNGELKRKWTWSVEWLHDELERGGGHRAPYASTAGNTVCLALSSSYLLHMF